MTWRADGWNDDMTEAPEGVSVLVYDPHEGRVMEARCDGPYGWGDPLYHEWNCDPTHWRHMPGVPL